MCVCVCGIDRPAAPARDPESMTDLARNPQPLSGRATSPARPAVRRAWSRNWAEARCAIVPWLPQFEAKDCAAMASSPLLLLSSRPAARACGVASRSMACVRVRLAPVSAARVLLGVAGVSGSLSQARSICGPGPRPGAHGGVGHAAGASAASGRSSAGRRAFSSGMAAAIRARSLLHATRPPWSVGAGWLGSWRSVVLFWWLLLSLLASSSVRASSCAIGGAGESTTRASRTRAGARSAGAGTTTASWATAR
jgi:hypothetical protein